MNIDSTDFFEVKISAENQSQADDILNSLLEKKLVTGGQFLNSKARFLWKGEVVDMNEYLTITSFTTSEKVEDIIEDVKSTSKEEVPMITFVKPEIMNSELKAWILATLNA